MKLQTLIEELERQKPLKWDKKINSSQLEMVLSENQIGLQVGGNNSFSITKPCHSQIAERLEIPTKYYNKMESEIPELLVRNVNTWIRRAEKDFVRHKDDLLIGGFLLTNSETGHKALRLEPRLFRVQCSNGMVIEEFKTRQVHLGNGDDGSDAMVYLSIRKSINELFGRFGDIIQSLRETTEIKINSPQKSIAASGLPARKHGTGYNPHIITVQFACDQFIDGSSHPSPDQSWVFHLRSCQRNHPLQIKPAGSKQPSDRNDILIVDTPHGFLITDRIQEMNVRASQPCRVGPGKLLHRYAGDSIARDIYTGTLADIHWAVRHSGNDLQTMAKILCMLFNDRSRIARQRVGIHSGNENRVRCAVWGRHLTVWPGAKHRPHAGLN
nr:DUF945 domain-containing protein [Candidatus Scalindua japonica]